MCVKFPSKDLDSQPLPWQRTHETCPPPQPLPWHRIFSLFKLFNYNLASSYMFKICSYNKLFVFPNVEVGLTIFVNLQFIIKNTLIYLIILLRYFLIEVVKLYFYI